LGKIVAFQHGLLGDKQQDEKEREDHIKNNTMRGCGVLA
jgi:hypothetical protein